MVYGIGVETGTIGDFYRRGPTHRHPNAYLFGHGATENINYKIQMRFVWLTNYKHSLFIK